MDGIGTLYRLAKTRDFPTIGIVSSVAEAEGAGFSPDADLIYVVTDDAWGGRKSDGSLSPTSAALVGASDEIVAIGGGTIARDEVAAARAEGKAVRYIPAEMNHAAALAKAEKLQQPADFKGEVHRLFDGT